MSRDWSDVLRPRSVRIAIAIALSVFFWAVGQASMSGGPLILILLIALEAP